MRWEPNEVFEKAGDPGVLGLREISYRTRDPFRETGFNIRPRELGYFAKAFWGSVTIIITIISVMVVKGF